jgi:L-iditol 2-dehydrogenase
MRAIVRRGGSASLEAVPAKDALPTTVVIGVAVAGVCRTDLYVADGLLACEDGRILGHELSGTVVSVGSGVTRVSAGDRVGVMPWLGCERCAACDGARPWRCTQARMLGVDVDGAFAEEIAVPERSVFRLPDGMPFVIGAYAEPVAATLAVRHARIERSDRVLVLGAGRFAELTRRVLAALGIAEVETIDEASARAVAHGAFDVVIEAIASERTLSAALDAVRPGGTVVLKSRPHAPVPFDVTRAVRREITVRAVGYAPFEEALALLGSGRLPVDDLLGDVAPLASFADVLAMARASEARKLFLAPHPERL